MRWARVISKLFLAELAVCAAAAGQDLPKPGVIAGPQLSSIVQRLQQAESESPSPSSYEVIREYRLIDTSSSRVSSSVVARIEYLPPGSKRYVIQTRTGSSRGEQVVRRILDQESEMSARSPQTLARTAITEENYVFTYLGEDTVDNNECHLLGLIPRRKERELIAGRAWVDAKTFKIRRIEGEMAKTPSWLLKKVRVRLDFGNVSGLWLQTGMEAVADVRFIGSQTLDSKTLDYRLTDELAVQARSHTPHPSRTIRRTLPAEVLLRPGNVQR